MAKKMYSAFISSVYESLLDEREVVINSMLNYSVFPICMEHFVVADNQRFEDLKKYIFDSDFFILLLGKEYGSTDINGKSWTQKEYEYAKKLGIETLAIKTEDYRRLEAQYKRDPSSLTKAEVKQVSFGSGIMAETTKNKEEIATVLGMFFAPRLLNGANEFVGWVRGESRKKSIENEKKWQEEHRFLDVNGDYYHLHIIPSDEKYLRSGTVSIRQVFNSRSYGFLEVEGINYAISYDAENKKMNEKQLKRTRWKGKYVMNENGQIEAGVYVARKEDTDAFGGRVVRPGVRRGFHDWGLQKDNEYGLVFTGSFHDEVLDDAGNNGKAGKILIFRTPEDRFRYIASNEELARILLNNKAVKLI